MATGHPSTDHTDAKQSPLDAPTPPGGPMRQDAPDGAETPGTEGQDPGTQVQRVTRPEETHEVAEHHDPGAEPGPAEELLREENADTTMDQPSQ